MFLDAVKMVIDFWKLKLTTMKTDSKDTEQVQQANSTIPVTNKSGLWTNTFAENHGDS